MGVLNSSITTVENGILDLNGNNFFPTGDVFVNNNGKIYIPGSSVLFLNTNLFVTGNGWLETSGTAGNLAFIQHPQGGYYSLEIYFGGTISSEFTHFKDMNSNGIHIHSGGNVEENHAFNDCIIDGGQNSTDAIRLRLYNNQVLTCNNVNFPNNPGIPNVYNVGKSIYDYGLVTFMNATGGFAGEAYEVDPFGRIDWVTQGVVLNLKVFLEGPFNGTSMNTAINSYLPLSHPFHPSLPYFGNMDPPWYYTGNESVTSIPNLNIVDWILIELRDAVNAGSANSSTIIAQQPAFLLSDGSVTALNGSAYPEFSVNPINNLFVVLWHRNYVGIMSANPVLPVGGIYEFDFSSGETQVYGGSGGHKELVVGSNVWGMIGGDGNADGQINNGDKNDVWVIQAGMNGYNAGDFNLDSQVNNGDKNEIWVPNTGMGGQVPSDGFKCQVPE